LGCIFIIAVGLISLDGRRPRLTRPVESLVLLSWMIVPPVLMFVYSQVRRPIFGPPRYHLFIAPAYLILLARGLTVLRPILRWTLAAGALALSLSLLDSNVYSQLVKSDWRALARWLNHEDKHEDSFESGR
jgi:mannosyltransferase